MKMVFAFLNQLFFEASTTLLIASLLIFLFYLLITCKNNKTQPPQPGGSWPVIGHLPLLGSGLPHITLSKLADKYGPIFMIKLGIHQALVVSSPDMARECLGGANDKVFVNRPQTVFVEHLGYNSAMFGFSPYGPYWREMRKIIVVELLSNHRLETLKSVRISEVRSATKVLFDNYQANEKSGVGSVTGIESVVDLKKWFIDINLNTSVKLIAGKSLNEFYPLGSEGYDLCQQALRDFFELAGAFVPADALPCLRWLDIGGYEKAMKKAAKDIDQVLQGWLEEHKRRKFDRQVKGKHDFMDVMLGILEKGMDTPSKFGADTIIKATCLAMLLGGADTTAVTLTWALSLLLNNRDCLKKAQAELDTHIGKQRHINESDLKNLTYLEAVLKETMRLYPAGPLSGPREAVTSCTVGGYHIRAGTRLFVNLYKLQRDPQAWPNPLEFRPERFITTHKDYDVRGQKFELLPFGSGRRICPGISLALQTMRFTLATLLHGFNFSTPLGETVDMTESFGLTNLKASPLDVILIPRLSDNLYDN